MKFELYQQIKLQQDLPEYGLEQSDEIILIGYIPPQGGEAGCMLETCNAAGEPMGIVIVPCSLLEPLSLASVT